MAPTDDPGSAPDSQSETQGSAAWANADGWAVPGVEMQQGQQDPTDFFGEASFELKTKLEQVKDALTEVLNAANLEMMTDALLVEAIFPLEEIGNAVAAAQTSMCQQIQQRTTTRPLPESLPRKFGCKNATDFLRETAHISGREANRRLRRAKAAYLRTVNLGDSSQPRFQNLTAAFESGKIGTETVDMITNTLVANQRAAYEDINYAERCLTEAATGDDCGSGNPVGHAHHPDSLRIMCSTWNQVLDPDGHEPDYTRQIAKRSLNLGNARDGLVPLWGNLVPETAALLARLLDAVNSPRNNKQKKGHEEAESNDVASDDPHLEDTEKTNLLDERSAANKRHDALATILQAASKSQDIPHLGGAPVTVLIQTSEDEITKSNPGVWLQDHHGNFTPTSVFAAEHAACAGSLQTYSQTKEGKLVSLGSPQRVFNHHQRRAIIIRDGGCIIPGCTIPSTWCEIHHVAPHSEGGETHTDNGVVLCWFHHRNLSTIGWQIRMKNGRPETKPPPWSPAKNGWRRHQPPHQITKRQT